MDKLFIAVLLTLVPFIELRGGLPLAIIHAKEQGIPLFPILILILFINAAVIILAFFFLDNLHEKFMKNKRYSKIFNYYIKKSRKKTELFQKRHKKIGFIALSLFTAIPLPITGAYSATLISWVTDLDRKKSIIAIFFGLIISEIIILFLTLGLI